MIHPSIMPPKDRHGTIIDSDQTKLIWILLRICVLRDRLEQIPYFPKFLDTQTFGNNSESLRKRFNYSKIPPKDAD